MGERSKTYGVCAICDFRADKAGMTRHLAKGPHAQDNPAGELAPLYHMRVEGADGLYWLDVEARANARLRHLDQFLREIWLECCGHLSEFEIEGVDYQVKLFPEDRGLESAFSQGFGPRSRSMSARLGDILFPGLAFRYRYDFGSTTQLRLKVVRAYDGRASRKPVRLLARNEAPLWHCAECTAAATKICALCGDYPEDIAFCEAHARVHGVNVHRGDDAAFLPVVNSPRMGVCAYAGPLDAP